MRADWTGKELGTDTLVNAGRTADGFVYFKMPNGQKPGGMTLEFDVETLTDGTRTPIRIIL